MKMANDSGPDREIRCLWKHYSMKPRQDVWKPCKRGELTSPLMILRCATRLNIYRWTTTFTLYHNNLLPIDLHERRLRELWVNVISIIEFLILWLAIDSGMAAIKYSDLQNNRYVVTVLNQYVSRARILQKSFIGSLTNYTFSYDRMLDMKVNIFFLYTFAPKTLTRTVFCPGKYGSVFTIYTRPSFINFISFRRQGGIKQFLKMLAGSLKNINTTVQDLKKFDVDENVLLSCYKCLWFSFLSFPAFIADSRKWEGESTRNSHPQAPRCARFLSSSKPTWYSLHRNLESHQELEFQELLPSRLCDYAYNLCVSFNEFYSCCKVSYRMICETQTSFFLSNKGQVWASVSFM
jgi:hypothetical protein